MIENKLPKFVKYPKIPYLDENKNLLAREVYIFEKIDGSLSQVRRTEKGIIGGSKANYISGSTKRPSWATKFLKWMHSNKSLYNLPSGLIIYGEWLDPVTLEYEKEFIDHFYFIDLAFVNENEEPVFYDYEEAIDYLYSWNIDGITILPRIGKKFINENEIRRIVIECPSYLRSAKLDDDNRLLKGEMEGIVIKNYKIQEFAKCLHPNYSELREQEKILEERYITQTRVQKAKRRLNDSGNQNFSLEDLVNEIVEDIKEESGKTFEHSAVKGVLRVHYY